MVYGGLEMGRLTFFDAVGDEEIVVLILVPYVAGLEVSIFRHTVGRCLIVLPVPFEDVRTGEPEFASFAWSKLFVVGGHVFGAHVREHFADGAD